MKKIVRIIRKFGSLEDKLKAGPGLKDFFENDNGRSEHGVTNEELNIFSDYSVLRDKRFSLKTFGCQMNSNDSEIVQTILMDKNMLLRENYDDSDIVLINTCAIRENAEQKIWALVNRIRVVKEEKVKRGEKFFIGILGCMAERLKEKIVEEKKVVDLIVGPDSYKDLPRLLSYLFSDLNQNLNNFAINTQLSMDETYADIIPVRTNQTASFISIMRGCSNMCSFCIVPFTRGVERSRPLKSIIDEVKYVRDQGVKEVTLLGQNVNSYFDQTSQTFFLQHKNSEGFNENFKRKSIPGARFIHLLDQASLEAPEVRFRFTSPHPKDFPDSVLDLIKERSNICKYLHMPAQSGSTAVLERMNRKYTAQAYFELIDRVRTTIPGVSLSTDLITGFCGETDEEFSDTLLLLEKVKFDFVM
jgi:MiaB/RimO family radical SAM methylthiotransferase